LTDDAIAVLKTATSALPRSLLLGFALADSHEALQRHSDAKQVYEQMLASNKTDSTLIYIQFMKAVQRMEVNRFFSLFFDLLSEE
jgi:cleavage stimulation factor subunit 3